MIALTQEKREELIKAAKLIAIGREDSITAQISRVALASLTAEKRATVDVVGVIWKEWKPEVGIPLFNAPPVPEIKFPNRNEIPDWVMDDDGFCTWYEAETKRLNGLGE